MSKDKTHSLTVLLMKESVGSPSDALKAGSHPKKMQFQVAGVAASLHYQRTPTRSPAWLSLLKPKVGTALDSFETSGCAAVLFVKQTGRLFALTFGYGRTLLKIDSFEENFGLKVVLNSVDPQKLRSIDAQSLDAVPVHTRSQAGTATALSDFGFDVERDLIYAATGRPRDPSLGKHITGKDALKLSIAVDLEGIPDLLGVLLGRYLATDYKADFGWIDNLTEIRAPSLVKSLDGALSKKLAAKHLDRSWLAPPEIIDWPDFDGFKYQQAKRGKLLDDISWDSYFAFVGGKATLDGDLLRRHHVLCMKSSSDHAGQEWSVYKCAYAEIELDGATYTLTNGKWFRVDENFLAALDKAVKEVPPCSLALPDYEDKTEGDYNKRVYQGDKGLFALMDTKNIPYGGSNNKIELCDLFTKDRKLIHVKRYGGSSVLSHLFSQGLVSARLLLGDADFRAAANKKLPSSHVLPKGKPSASDYEVVYAIASKSPNDFALPLFSKINLRNSYRQLQLLGLKCSIAIVAAKSGDDPEQGDDD